MITRADHFGIYTELETPEFCANSDDLLSHVNALITRANSEGITSPVNPVTGTRVSGHLYGGVRPLNCPQGAANSAHKQAMAIDIYDPYNMLDTWVTDVILEEFSLYRESPEATPNWLHLTRRAPPSGNRTFIP